MHAHVVWHSARFGNMWMMCEVRSRQFDIWPEKRRVSDGETVKEVSFSAQFARKRTLVTATRTQDCATHTCEHRHNYDRPL